MWKTDINGERLFTVWPTLIARTAKDKQAGTHIGCGNFYVNFVAPNMAVYNET